MIGRNYRYGLTFIYLYKSRKKPRGSWRRNDSTGYGNMSRSCLLRCTGKSLSEALIFASTNPQYDDRLFIELQVQCMKIPSSEHWEKTLCTEIVFGIQKNVCIQHVLPMFCKKKSFWQWFTCTQTNVNSFCSHVILELPPVTTEREQWVKRDDLQSIDRASKVYFFYKKKAEIGLQSISAAEMYFKLHNSKYLVRQIHIVRVGPLL